MTSELPPFHLLCLVIVESIQENEI